VLIIAFQSCYESNSDIITLDLLRSDFVEKLYAEGTVKALSNFPVVVPRNNYANMTVGYIIEDGSYVKKGDTICILSSPELVNLYESFVTELEKMEAELKKLEADNALNMAILKAQLDNSKAQIAINFLDSVQMKFAPPVRQKLMALEMEKSSLEKKKLEKRYSAQGIIDNSEVRQMRSRLLQQQSRVQMMKDQITSLTIVAQRDGLVMRSETPKFMVMYSGGSGSVMGGKIAEGSIVFPNMVVLEFPGMNKMQVSAEMAESDYKRVEKGQKVAVSIDAVKDLYTTGKINRKTLVGKTGQQDSKVKSYEVIIDIDSCDLLMKPGLSARCEITIEEVKDTVVVPTLAIFERDSIKVTYVAEGKKFIRIPVETGKANSSHTIIAKGLKGNETIALTEPAHNMIKTTKRKKNREADPGIIPGSDSTDIKNIEKLTSKK
jgi:multidrug efflux pump subunit AcrA (membrane-fusion protein)